MVQPGLAAPVVQSAPGGTPHRGPAQQGWAARAEPRLPKLRQASKYTRCSHCTARKGTLAGSKKNHRYHLDMSDFHMKTRCPGYNSLVWMMASTMDWEFGKVIFHGAFLWNLGLMNELIPPST